MHVFMTSGHTSQRSNRRSTLPTLHSFFYPWTALSVLESKSEEPWRGGSLLAQLCLAHFVGEEGSYRSIGVVGLPWRRRTVIHVRTGTTRRWDHTISALVCRLGLLSCWLQGVPLATTSATFAPPCSWLISLMLLVFRYTHVTLMLCW